MVIFDALFGRRAPEPIPPAAPRYSEADIQIIGDMARRQTEVVNESLQIAVDSHDPQTKLSRLGVAKQKLAESKQLAAQYPFIRLTSLAEIERDIAQLEQQFEQAGYQAVAEGNSRGEALEREGRLEDAIAEYERLLHLGTDTPFTYRRLVILYRKSKFPADELRVLQAALQHVPQSNMAHYEWFRDRLNKAKSRRT